MRPAYDITPEEREDYKQYIRSGFPFRLGDIVVEDIDIDSDYDARLLTRALAGEFKAERDLIRRVAARRKQRREREAMEAILERNANKLNNYSNQI